MKKCSVTKKKSINIKTAFRAKIVVVLGLFLVFSSCRSYREVPYFQDLKRSSVTEEKINNYSPLIIEPNDIIGVNVLSLNADASAAFNYNPENNPNTGYLVNQNGEIKLPMLGIVKVGGLSTEQVRSQLQKSLLTYLREPAVNVRVLNFKISVLGDVARPNVYQVPGERVTIPEALSMAGDLNITGLRNILLIRENKGKREYVPIDLRSKDLFNSPYYYLKNNDMIYVNPDKTKLALLENGKFTLGLTILSILGFAVTQALVK